MTDMLRDTNENDSSRPLLDDSADSDIHYFTRRRSEEQLPQQEPYSLRFRIALPALIYG